MSSIALRYAPERDEALLYVNGGYYKVLKSLKTYDQKHTLATWIRRILVNHIIDEFRKQQKYIANIELAEHINDLNSADYNIGESHFDVEDLRAMLNTLPVVTSKVFNLFHKAILSECEYGRRDVQHGSRDILFLGGLILSVA
jgi:RNA polymerase sigma factor (sigma-70 family)